MSEPTPVVPLPSHVPGRPHPLLAWGIILAAAALFFAAGTAIGDRYFWRNYDKAPRLERDFSTAMDRVKADPNKADNQVALGWAYYQKGEYNEALARYRKAIELDEKHYTAHYNLGLTYMMTEKYDRAISAFERAVKLVPKAYAAHYQLGRALAATAKYQEAINELEVAYQLKPGEVQIVTELGEIFEKMGQKDEAIRRYQAALEFDPDYRPALDALRRVKGQG